MEIPPLEQLIQKKHFFISYNKADRKWAEWIAWQLEAEGYRVIIQAWDFRPGSNFIYEMDKATKEAERTILVLSPDYFASPFTKPEWFARFAKDPTGAGLMLVPIRVRECEPEGLLGQIVYIDLFGKNKNESVEILLSAVRHGRAKPTTPPVFPGTVRHTLQEQPTFPGYVPQPLSLQRLYQNFETAAQSNPYITQSLKDQELPKSFKIAGSIILVLLFFGLIGWFIISQVADANYKDSPDYRLQDFCNALKHHDYQTAYNDLLDSLQNNMKETQFVSNIHAVADSRDGIGDCTTTIDNQFGTIAHGTITFIFGDGSKRKEMYELFQNVYNYWLISKWNF